MGMFSEIATETTIQVVVDEIKKGLANTQSPQAREAMKTIGRFALTQFEWSIPGWAEEYTKLFKKEYETKRLRILPNETRDIIPHLRVQVFGKDNSGFTIVEALLKPGEGVCWRCGSIANDPKNDLQICPICGKDFND